MSTYPSFCQSFLPRTITLCGGTTLTVREIQPDDLARLQAFFSRLSANTLRMRYLGTVKPPDECALREVCTSDPADHTHLVAVQPDKPNERIIALTSYIRDQHHPDVADFSILIEDAWHRQGVGTHLFAALIDHARSNGIRAFSIITRYDNTGMLKLVHNCGLPSASCIDQGTVEIVVMLDPAMRVDIDPITHETRPDAA